MSNYLREYVYGVEFNMPRIDSSNSEALYIQELGEGKCKVGTALKVLEVNYNVFDMDEITFLNIGKEVFDGVVIDYDVDYKFIYVKQGQDINYYIQIAVEGSDISTIKMRLLDSLHQIKRVLENAGMRVVVADEDDLKYPIKIEEMKPRYGLPTLLFMFGLFLMYKSIFPDLIHIHPSFNILSVFGLVFIILSMLSLKRKGKYKLLDKVIITENDLTTTREKPDPTEYWRNAQNLHNALNKSPYNYVMILSVSPVSSGEFEKMKSKYYLKSKWAIALGREEWMDESTKMKMLLDRKDRGEEMIYKYNIRIFTSPESAGIIKSRLDSIGHVAKMPYTVSKYMDIY